KARGAVVDAPGRLHRRPEAVDEPLVAVDRRPEHRREFNERRELPCEVALEQIAHSVTALGIVKEVLLSVRKRLMAVARASRILRAPFRHEARHDAEACADLLRAGLEQRTAIGGLAR